MNSNDPEFVEIELLNHKRILIPNQWHKIYNLVEKERHIFRFTRKFPFVKIEKQRYVSFRFQTVYETLRDFADKHYKVNCLLRHFLALFGVKNVKSFEQGRIEGDLER